MNALEGYVEDFIEAIGLYSRLEDAAGRNGQVHDEIIRGLGELKARLGFDSSAADIKSLIRESKEGVDRILATVRALKDFSCHERAERVEYDVNRVHGERNQDRLA